MLNVLEGDIISHNPNGPTHCNNDFLETGQSELIPYAFQND
jgi:hypothetical protein